MDFGLYWTSPCQHNPNGTIWSLCLTALCVCPMVCTANNGVLYFQSEHPGRTFNISFTVSNGAAISLSPDTPNTDIVSDTMYLDLLDGTGHVDLCNSNISSHMPFQLCHVIIWSTSIHVRVMSVMMIDPDRYLCLLDSCSKMLGNQEMCTDCNREFPTVKR